MRGIFFSSTLHLVAVLGALLTAYVHLAVGGALSGVAHGPHVSEGEREADAAGPADRLFRFESVDEDRAEQMPLISSGTYVSAEQDQLPLSDAVSAVAAAAERSRWLLLLRMLSPETRQPRRPQTHAASSATGSSNKSVFRRPSRQIGTAERLKRLVPKHDPRGKGTSIYV